MTAAAVLFVDKEVSVLNASLQLFSGSSDLRLLVASSGEEAVEIVLKEDVRLVVSEK